MGDPPGIEDEHAVCNQRAFSLDQNNFAFRFVYKYKCLGGLYRQTIIETAITDCLKSGNPLVYQNECLRDLESK